MTMGDSETVVAQTSDASEYANVDSNAAGKSEVTDVNSSGNPASIPNTSVESQLSAYHSSVNGNDTSDGKTTPAGVSENGVSSYGEHDSTSANQPQDGSGAALSPEEERLWSMVNANSLTSLMDNGYSSSSECDSDLEAILTIANSYNAEMVAIVNAISSDTEDDEEVASIPRGPRRYVPRDREAAGGRLYRDYFADN